MSRKRTPEEVIEALIVQRRALAASCTAYDSGHKWEALRLATVVYILVSDGRNQRSLLTQLGLKGSLKFISSNRVGSMNEVLANVFPHAKRPTNMLEETSLVKIAMGPARVAYMPLYDAVPFGKRVTFEEWWEGELIFTDGPQNNITLTRKQLVAALRNQEGGAHFDPELTNPSYVEFVHGDRPTGGPASQPLETLTDRELASMRQIAWEVTRTLDEHDKATE
jgi:hypothetical protein